MPSPSTAKSHSTPERLLETAERLFAERGIEAVSTREIARAAGQRNHSVVAYHFGAKDELVQRILDLRLLPIDERRRAILSQLEASGTTGDVRSLVAALVVPFAECLIAGSDESHYIGFMSQLMALPGGQAIVQRNPERMASNLEASRLLQRALADVPREAREARLRFLPVQITQIVADWDRRRRAGEPGFDAQRIGFLTTTLVDTLTAGLLAPVSRDPTGSPARMESLTWKPTSPSRS